MVVLVVSPLPMVYANAVHVLDKDGCARDVTWVQNSDKSRLWGNRLGLYSDEVLLHSILPGVGHD